MSLILQESVCESNNCSTILFSDITGAYNSSSNPGGYGTPNLDISSVIETHIKITLPDGSTLIDILNPIGLPTIDPNFQYTINALTLSNNATIVDGLYKIEYTVSDGTNIYTTSIRYFLFTCNIECCVSKLFAKIALVKDCNCDSNVIKNALYASALLEGLKANGDCANITLINDLITKLNKICGFTSSDCGCR